MEFVVINNVYSMFGNFSNCIQKKEELKNAFNGYELNELKERLQNGMEAPVLRFIKENVGITIRVTRIDLEYANRSADYDSEKFLESTLDVANKLNEVFKDLRGNRIAYNQTAFVSNEDLKVVNKLDEAFNGRKIFDEPTKEFSIRFNHIKTIGEEECNSIILCQDGRVTNNKTKEEQQVVFINTDINTVIFNQEARFSFADAKTYLSDMVLESKDSVHKITSLLD